MTEARTTPRTETTALFLDYLNTCNAVFAANKHEFPFDQIIKQANKILANKTIGVRVYEDDPARPKETFTIRMSNGQLHMVEDSDKRPNLTWKVKTEYMRKVVDHKQEYIEHPTKLDLDWLKSRIGL